MAQELVNRGTFQPAPFVVEHDSRQQSVEQVLYVLFRRKWLIAGLFIAFSAAAVIAVWMRPDVRSASAKILLKPDRLSLQISELAPASARVPYSEELLKSEIELMESRDVLRPVAEKLFAEDHPGQTASPDTIDGIVDDLDSHLVTETVGQASVIKLEYFASTAQQAERVLKMLVDQYLEQHAIAYSGSTQLLSFYNNEKEQSGKALQESEDALQKWQAENNIVSIDEQISNLLDQRSDQQRELEATQAGQETSLQENVLLNRLEGDRVNAQVALNDLLSRYTEQDRHVQEARARLKLIQDQLNAARKSILGSVSTKKQALGDQIGKTSAALDNLRQKKLEGERLTRTVNTTRDAYLLYGKKVEEARIQNQLSREQLSNVAVVEHPHVTEWTDEQERLGTMLLASIVGLTLGIVMAFALAFFSKSVRTRRDVEAYLNLPVLATIPQLSLARIPDMRRKS